MDAFESRIIAVVADELGIPETEVTSQSWFADDFGVDTFGVAELALRLGDELGVTLSAGDIEAVGSVRDLIDALRELTPQAS